MGEFFKGWRRKAGCVTLGLACVFAAGWVRSYGIKDAFFLGKTHKPDSHSVVSFRGGITWARRTTDNERTFGTVWHCERIDPIDSFFIYIPGMITEWALSKSGFGAGASHDLEAPSWRLAWWTIPYYAVALPLTLLSTYLLLWPSKRSKSPSPN